MLTRVRFGPLMILVIGCATPEADIPGELRGTTGIHYGEQDEAAKAACKLIRERESDAEKWEFCGCLYQDSEGIQVGLPKTDRKATQCRPECSPSPDGMKLVGRYHNHRITAEPSHIDRMIAKQNPLLGHYLCSPSGIVRRFSAMEGFVIVR